MPRPPPKCNADPAKHSLVSTSPTIHLIYSQRPWSNIFTSILERTSAPIYRLRARRHNGRPFAHPLHTGGRRSSADRPGQTNLSQKCRRASIRQSHDWHIWYNSQWKWRHDTICFNAIWNDSMDATDKREFYLPSPLRGK